VRKQLKERAEGMTWKKKGQGLGMKANGMKVRKNEWRGDGKKKGTEKKLGTNDIEKKEGRKTKDGGSGIKDSERRVKKIEEE
jgi:hypothetical protein